MDMLIRPLTPDDEMFLWDALYCAIYVPPGEPPPAHEIIKEPQLARYVVGCRRTWPASTVILTNVPSSAATLSISLEKSSAASSSSIAASKVKPSVNWTVVGRFVVVGKVVVANDDFGRWLPTHGCR